MTDLELKHHASVLKEKIVRRMPDNPVLHGAKIFSQSDEDGIIRHILNKIGACSALTRTFIEFGCGNGLENNTHALLQGYSGCI